MTVAAGIAARHRSAAEQLLTSNLQVLTLMQHTGASKVPPVASIFLILISMLHSQLLIPNQAITDMPEGSP
jgi:hypothetical protein